jgi:hypothetical protein
LSGIRGLTPEMQLRVHLSQAHELWREDRLDLAEAAMRKALRVGIPSGHWFNLQRTIEAEQGTRSVSERLRISEELVLEAHPAVWAGGWRRVAEAAQSAVRRVTGTIDVHWGKPLLLTLIPNDEWMEFMRSRYGYYAERAESHKVCLPPSAARSEELLRRAILHEFTHAAVHQVTGDAAPRWLDEGLAVTMEGGAGTVPQHAVRLRLDQLSGYFESPDADLKSSQAHLCYSQAGEFVTSLIHGYGLGRLKALLREIGRGKPLDKAFRDGYGIPLRDAERGWIRDGNA